MERNVRSLSTTSSNVRQDVYPFDQWTITTRKGIILQSKCTCSDSKTDSDGPNNDTSSDKLCNICNYIGALPQLHSMPDMLFNENVLKLEHYTGVGIEFNALDALKLVKGTKDPLQVAVADGWQSARADFPFAKSVVKPFDWTFTTDYKGTLLMSIRKNRQFSTSLARSLISTSNPASQVVKQTTELPSEAPESEVQRVSQQNKLLVEETDERIDVNKLKVREEILFYDDLTLYEDELADHGTAHYSVKVRVMPRSIFILARFYLRVDGVLARINDTRIYHEVNKQYLLREYTNREAKLSPLNLPVSTLVNPNELVNHLPLIDSSYERLTILKLR